VTFAATPEPGMVEHCCDLRYSGGGTGRSSLRPAQIKLDLISKIKDK
jgi:hypothetical protein